MPRVGIGTPPAENAAIPEVANAPWLNPMLASLATDPQYSGALDSLKTYNGVPSVYLPLLKRTLETLRIPDRRFPIVYDEVGKTIYVCYEHIGFDS